MKPAAKQTRLFEAAKPSDFHRVAQSSGTADYVVNHAGTRLRDYARHLDENSDIAIGGLDILVNNVVGSGIGIEPAAQTRRGVRVGVVNHKIRKLLREWSKKADVTRELSFSELQRLSCRTWLRDGEVFAEHVQGAVRANRDRRVPYCVRAIEPDWLPYELNSQKPERIIHGVEKDDDGIPLAYHFYIDLGDPHYARYSTQFDVRRVPSERIVHLKFSRRLNQTRGISVFSGVIHRLDDIVDIEDSERIACRIAADFTAAIIRNPDLIDDMPEQTHETETGDVAGTDRYKNRYLEMGPGAVWDTLLPGETVQGIGLDRPNNNLIDFLADQHRRVASGIGCSYSSLSKRYDGTYSSQRQEMQEQKGSYDKLRNQFIGKFVEPIYERFIFWAVESGALVVPRSVDMETLTRADYRAPAMPWIDPKKESDAAAIDVEQGFKSRHMIIRERGNDPELVDAQIQADLFQPAAQAYSEGPPRDDNEDDT